MSQAVSDQKEYLAILQSVLKDEPENSAANHYWIHALEAGPHPEQALRSAEILASLAPNSGHMVHMPGHIFYLIGDYATSREGIHRFNGSGRALRAGAAHPASMMIGIMSTT